MKKFVSILFVLFLGLVLVACGSDKNADIVTTMFPQYDFARAIAGDKLTVSLLTPPGVEPHEFEASSKDMVAIKNAKLFIFTSLEMEPWINDPSAIGGTNTVVLDLSQSYTLAPHRHHGDHTHDHGHSHDHDDTHEGDHTHEASFGNVTLGGTVVSSHHDHDDHDDHDHDALHYWTDPTTALQLLDAILEKIIEIDPENAEYYTNNAHAYEHALEDLHLEIDAFFQLEANHDITIYFAGHNALGAFGSRYHIEIISLFPDFKPDQDLTSAQLIAFITLVKSTGAKTLFIEELLEPKAALTIVNELAKENYTLTLLEFHAYHNLTKEDMESGVTYIDLLQRNFDHLKLALSATIV